MLLLNQQIVKLRMKHLSDIEIADIHFIMAVLCKGGLFQEEAVMRLLHFLQFDISPMVFEPFIIGAMHINFTWIKHSP